MRMTEAMRAAISNGKEAPTLIDDDATRREAMMQDAQEMGTRGNEKKQVDHMWVDRMQQDLMTRKGIRPYVGKRNAKRKGTIRNNVERVALNRCNRKG